MFRIIWRRRVIYPDKSKIIFKSGQNISILGKEFSISVQENVPLKYSVAKLDGSAVRVFIASGISKRKTGEYVSALARRAVSRAVLPLVEQRVREFNEKYFGSTLGKVRIKDNLSNWGSCSSRNNINLDFRLLLGPSEILDAVIVHELAHTKHRNHSREFHDALQRAMPDSKEKMKWLKKNGRMLTTDAVGLNYAPTQRIEARLEVTDSGNAGDDLAGVA
jgi:predicted metal-dependent hydrolase